MKRLTFILTTLIGGQALALDLCRSYGQIHQREVIKKLQTGIPFRLLSVSLTADGSRQRVIRLRQDLWTEKVEVQVLGQEQSVWVSKEEAEKKICTILSAESDASKVKRIDILLNPAPTASLDRIAKQVRESQKGLIQVDLKKIADKLESEQVLLSVEE